MHSHRVRPFFKNLFLSSYPKVTTKIISISLPHPPPPHTHTQTTPTHLPKRRVLWLWKNTTTKDLSRLPGESCHRQLRSLLLCSCDIFWVLINSLVCWLCRSYLGLILFQILKECTSTYPWGSSCQEQRHRPRQWPVSAQCSPRPWCCPRQRSDQHKHSSNQSSGYHPHHKVSPTPSQHVHKHQPSKFYYPAFTLPVPAELVNQPACQPTNQPASQPARQPTSQSASQPTNQPINQPASQLTNQPTSQPANQPTSQPANQPTSQSASHQSTNQPTSQPATNQPTIQPTYHSNSGNHTKLSIHYNTLPPVPSLPPPSHAPQASDLPPDESSSCWSERVWWHGSRPAGGTRSEAPPPHCLQPRWNHPPGSPGRSVARPLAAGWSCGGTASWCPSCQTSRPCHQSADTLSFPPAIQLLFKATAFLLDYPNTCVR